MSVFNSKFSIKDIKPNSDIAVTYRLSAGNTDSVDRDINELFPKREYRESFDNDSDTVTKASSVSKKRVKFRPDLVSVVHIDNNEIVNKKNITCTCLIF